MRKIDPARRCLLVADWPTADQLLWNEIVCGDGYECEAERPKWRPNTIQANREGYGRFLNHLIRCGGDPSMTPADRVTPERVRAYLQELHGQGIRTQTRANRMLQLAAVMQVFAPEREWDWLKALYNRLVLLANEERRDRTLTILSGDILDRALKAVAAVERHGLAPDFAAAIEYRNWLMVASLALLAPRRANFAGLSEHHLHCLPDRWEIHISAKEAKQKKPIKLPVPSVLHSHFEFYFEHVRPRLLAGRASDRIWITNRHTPMTSHSVYIAITSFTREVFGQAINPHKFRHIGATSAVLVDPENIEAARAFLTHGHANMTEGHYVIARSVAASRQQGKLIKELRRRLVPANHQEMLAGAMDECARVRSG